jgi:hypothetical protein
VILVTHLLLCPSHSNLPTVNIVLLLACAVNFGPIVPDSEMISRHARVNTDIDIDTFHVFNVHLKYRYKDLVGALLRPSYTVIYGCIWCLLNKRK